MLVKERAGRTPRHAGASPLASTLGQDAPDPQLAVDLGVGWLRDNHERLVKDGRDIAVLRLLDLSESVNDAPATGQSTPTWRFMASQGSRA